MNPFHTSAFLFGAKQSSSVHWASRNTLNAIATGVFAESFIMIGSKIRQSFLPSQVVRSQAMQCPTKVIGLPLWLDLTVVGSYRAWLPTLLLKMRLM